VNLSPVRLRVVNLSFVRQSEEKQTRTEARAGWPSVKIKTPHRDVGNIVMIMHAVRRFSYLAGCKSQS
jgi:hypothetical protein